MTISSGEIKRNMTIVLDNEIYQIMDWQHRQAPKAPPTLTLKIRQLSTGKVFERKLPGNQRLTHAPTETKNCQYLYSERENHVFMDNKTFDQFELDDRQVQNTLDYIAEGESVNIRFYQDTPLYIELPPAVVLEITHTEHGVKGDTQSAATKPATTQTGLTLQVPLFVKVGTKVSVNTQTGEYLGRA